MLGMDIGLYVGTIVESLSKSLHGIEVLWAYQTKHWPELTWAAGAGQ